MATLRRIVLIRHGETDGESSIRYLGSTDVGLSESGREQIRRMLPELGQERFDCVVASPLRRAWQSAWILGRGAPVQLEPDFREIHFGRWEGLTRAEIEARDPVPFRDWQAGVQGFEYPDGEPRGEFKARVERGLSRLLAAPARTALVVTHKGVIRTIAEGLTGRALEADRPALASAIQVTRAADDSWFLGRRSSNPPGL